MRIKRQSSLIRPTVGTFRIGRRKFQEVVRGRPFDPVARRTGIPAKPQRVLPNTRITDLPTLPVLPYQDKSIGTRRFGTRSCPFHGVGQIHCQRFVRITDGRWHNERPETS
jgi:hypothetical protein